MKSKASKKQLFSNHNRFQDTKNTKQKSKQQLMVEAAQKIYGIKVKKWKMAGGLGGDTNIFLEVHQPVKKLFLKVSQRSKQRLIQQTEVFNFLKQNHRSIQYPGTIKSLKGNIVPWFKVLDKVYRFCLMDFIEGKQMSRTQKYSPKSLKKIGQIIGEMSLCLAYYPKKVSSSYMISYELKAMNYYAQNKNPHEFYRNFIDKYEKQFLPERSKRPLTVIHGDLHRGNILVNDKEEIIAIVDLGTVGMSHPGYDIGTLIADLRFGNYSLGEVAEVLKGYQKIFPLTNRQLSFFFYFYYSRFMFLRGVFEKYVGKRIEQMTKNEKQAQVEKILLDGLLYDESEKYGWKYIEKAGYYPKNKQKNEQKQLSLKIENKNQSIEQKKVEE